MGDDLTLSTAADPSKGAETALTWLVGLVEVAGALIILIGAAMAFVRFLDAVTRSRHEPSRLAAVRLSLGGYLLLGLEFQLASDVLRTAVTPTLEALGELGALAALRTALSYVLHREVEQARLLPSAGTERTPDRR